MFCNKTFRSTVSVNFCYFIVFQVRSKHSLINQSLHYKQHSFNLILRKKSVRLRIFSGPHFPVFALNTEIYRVNLPIQSECGNMQTRKTPNIDTFYTVSVDPMGDYALIRNNMRILGKKCEKANTILSRILSGKYFGSFNFIFAKAVHLFSYERKWLQQFVISLLYLFCGDLAAFFVL